MGRAGTHQGIRAFAVLAQQICKGVVTIWEVKNDFH